MQKKPRLGQNFLVDADACRRVADALGDVSQDTVLEIGPGRGALTRHLARRAGHLTLAEYDAALAAALAREFADAERVEVLHTDILALDLGRLAHSRPLAVIGNLPYYITSEILLHLVRHHSAIDRAVLMVQREVADRVTARPGTREYGLLSATVQLYAEAEPLFTLAPGSFSPPPEVFSTVFRLRMAPRLAELGVESGAFQSFLRTSFAQKRKTWANNLRAGGFPAALVSRSLEAAGLDPSVRAEAVGLTAMAAVFHALHAAG